MIKYTYVVNLVYNTEKNKILNRILSYFLTFQLHYDDDALLSSSILGK